jgi:ABC-2 type transport system permease protein
MENLESYGVIVSFVNLPLFFLSGALFPISAGHVPDWLQTASYFNPLTYGVDALRTVILGNAWQPSYPFYYDLLMIILFDLSMIIIGTIALNRRK